MLSKDDDSCIGYSGNLAKLGLLCAFAKLRENGFVTLDRMGDMFYEYCCCGAYYDSFLLSIF
jgi:hypothetical protein